MADCNCAVFQRNTTIALGFLMAGLVYLLFVHFYKENYRGSGLLNNVQVYTSGATMRRLGQKFSATNQGVYTTVHNAEIAEGAPVPVVIFPADKVPAHMISY